MSFRTMIRSPLDLRNSCRVSGRLFLLKDVRVGRARNQPASQGLRDRVTNSEDPEASEQRILTSRSPGGRKPTATAPAGSLSAGNLLPAPGTMSPRWVLTGGKARASPGALWSGPCSRHGAPPSRPPHLPEAPPPNTITWGLGLQHVNLGDAFRPQQTVGSWTAASVHWAAPEARTRAGPRSALARTLPRFGLSGASAREHRAVVPRASCSPTTARLPPGDTEPAGGRRALRAGPVPAAPLGPALPARNGAERAGEDAPYRSEPHPSMRRKPGRAAPDPRASQTGDWSPDLGPPGQAASAEPGIPARRAHPTGRTGPGAPAGEVGVGHRVARRITDRESGCRALSGTPGSSEGSAHSPGTARIAASGCWRGRSILRGAASPLLSSSPLSPRFHAAVPPPPRIARPPPVSLRFGGNGLK